MAANPVTRLFWLVAAAVVAIALSSFALSYAALVQLAAANGVAGWLSNLWPLIVDVSVIVFTAAILVAQLQKRGARLPIALTGFYALVTITGNIWHAPPSALGWFVAALPPLSLIFATEMLRAMAHHIIAQQQAAATLAETVRQTDSARAELSALEQKLRTVQHRLAQADAASDAAKSSKNVDFAASMRSGKQQKIEERRQGVLQLAQAGHNDKEIAALLQKDVRTIRKDLIALNGQVAA